MRPLRSNGGRRNIRSMDASTYASLHEGSRYVMNDPSHKKEDMEKWMVENKARFDAA